MLKTNGQLLVSVTLRVYVPAACELILLVVDPVFQSKLYPGVPPVKTTVELPFMNPKQVTFKLVKVALIAVGWVILIDIDAGQLFAS